MITIARLPSMLGKEYYLSPEYWLSRRSVERQNAGIPLSDVAIGLRRTVNRVEDDDVVLDTGNSEGGFLALKLLRENEGSSRSSSKKEVPEGAVIISRLRPYLKQVAYIPYGTLSILGAKRILASTEFYVYIPRKPDCEIAFLVAWFLSPSVQEVFLSATTGGHHPRFDQDLIDSLMIPLEVVEKSNMINLKISELVKKNLVGQKEMQRIVFEA